MQCPYCEEELEEILFTDYGRKVWDEEAQKWKTDDNFGAIEFRCPHCGLSIEYPQLEEMGVI